ncbi:MAG: shikimate dehydrogenase family protein [Thermodesulfobacteriota bacterium]
MPEVQRDVAPPQALYGVVGHPVGHSLSPFLHSWAFAHLDIPAVYMKWDIGPEDFDAFMVAVRVLPIGGVSVTLPHKQRVIPYLDHMTSEAVDIEAVNTIFWQQGELWGSNTDCLGIQWPLQERSIQPDSALVLGAGGAALAAVAALRSLGCARIFLSARDQARAAGAGGGSDIHIVPWEDRGDCAVDVLINSTPLGMAGKLEDMSPWPDGQSLNSVRWVFDLVYTPIRTRLLQEAAGQGCGTISGLHMFVHQALGQCRAWTGRGFDPQTAMTCLRDWMS